LANNVTLDAMIRREDFAADGTPISSAEAIQTLSVESLGSTGLLISLLRKPDFQRETNHWSPEQVVSFLESFLDNELIPSIILWRSSSYVFVIDGGHRLSALRAWIEDDYGAGNVSIGYFSNNLTEEQKKVSQKTQKLVEERVGSHKIVRSALLNPEGHSYKMVQRARNMATRSLSLQWVTGDADKAETSFFKINTQGTPLDTSEELLLRNRRRSIAIAARSVVRAATGHSYWSKFPKANKEVVEEKAKLLHSLLFNPEVGVPIKTLDLPLGGSKSPLHALELLMSLISITNAPQGQYKKAIIEFPEDPDGSETIAVLDACLKVISRVTGSGPGSLGLHPAVYYYSERGRHIPDLLLGVLLLFRRKLQDNNSQFMKKFTQVREALESYLIANKSLLTQALQLARSQTRPEKVADLFDYLVEELHSGKGVDETGVVSIFAPNSSSKVLSVTQSSKGGRTFSDDAKAAIFIRDSLGAALKCPVCKGYLDNQKSVSYDHVVRVREGGLGSDGNGQLTHPFCNTGMKN